jgi:hypothetical protein
MDWQPGMEKYIQYIHACNLPYTRMDIMYSVNRVIWRQGVDQEGEYVPGQASGSIREHSDMGKQPLHVKHSINFAPLSQSM